MKVKGVILALVVMLIGSVTLFAAGSGEAKAVEYPTKPIELVLPVGPGGDTDVNGRIFAKYLSQELGKNVVIINMGGAGGSIGTEAVVNAKPDGYKVVGYHNSTILNELQGVSNINYRKSLKVASVPLVDETAIMVARTDSGWKNFADMIAYAKANPGKVKVGMETATLAHLVPVVIEAITEVDLNIIDVGAAAPRLSNLLGGHIDTFFVQYGLVKDYIETGEFVALCALADARNPLYPDVPTAKELGWDINFDKFFYFAFPNDTPDEIVAIFNKAVEKVTKNPQLLAEFEKLYLFPRYYDTDSSLEIMDRVDAFYSNYMHLFT
jgi:tripartite-type tricarboxylate transporter receptor subunit TctC